MSILIRFLLPNQQQICEKQYDKSIQVSKIFDEIHSSFDYFDQQEFHLDWLFHSLALECLIGYDERRLDQLYENQTNDILIFINYMITGVRLYDWYGKAINKNFDQVQQNDEKNHKLINHLFEGCLLFTCEQFYQSLDEYLDALELNIFKEDAILGIVSCLISLNCCDSAIKLVDIVLRINPQNSLAYYYKGKSFNKSKQFNLALNCLKQAYQINSSMKSSYEEELRIAKLGIQNKKNLNLQFQLE